MKRRQCGANRPRITALRLHPGYDAVTGTDLFPLNHQISPAIAMVIETRDRFISSRIIFPQRADFGLPRSSADLVCRF
jgi:hypothetical protein